MPLDPRIREAINRADAGSDARLAVPPLTAEQRQRLLELLRHAPITEAERLGLLPSEIEHRPVARELRDRPSRDDIDCDLAEAVDLVESNPIMREKLTRARRKAI